MPNIPNWCLRPLDSRAHAGGEQGLNNKTYRGGEFLPFYVPRDVMPQIDSNLYPKLIEFGKVQGVVFEQETIAPEALKPHQHVDKLKAKHLGNVEQAFNKPVLISCDLFILDGNHRWLSHLIAKRDVPVYKINREFEDAIKFLFEFPETYYYGDGAAHPVSY